MWDMGPGSPTGGARCAPCSPQRTFQVVEKKSNSWFPASAVIFWVVFQPGTRAADLACAMQGGDMSLCSECARESKLGMEGRALSPIGRLLGEGFKLQT